MEILKNFATTVGLDHTFFYQFILIVVLYFLMKKLFLQSYCENLEKRREMTKGSFLESQKKEIEIENLKKVYSEKAQALNKKFQSKFGVIKESVEKKFKEERAAIQAQHIEGLKKQKEHLTNHKDQENKKLEKEIPALVQALINKMLGKA
ncbi:MAG: hypothetical protein ACR2M7_00030 [Bdellovibrionales bacterium]